MSGGRRAAASGPRRARLRLAAAVALIVVGLLVAGGTLGAALLVRRYDSSVAQDTLLAPSARAQRLGNGTLNGPLNILLLGSDYRSSNPLMGQRADTIIVVHLTRNLDQAFLVSIPRDLRVEMPPAPALGFAGAVGKINAAFDYGKGGRGGIQLLSLTLTRLLGIGFDAAAVVNFAGLKKAVDVLGGVSMCVDVRTTSIHTGAVFEPGCRMMGASQVLDYLRQRNYPDGDFTRQRHQQQFLKAIAERGLRDELLADPLRLDGLIQAVAQCLTVDTGGRSVSDFVLGMRRLRPAQVTGIRLPFGLTMIEKESYVLAAPQSSSLFAAIRSDTLAAWVRANGSWVNRI